MEETKETKKTTTRTKKVKEEKVVEVDKEKIEMAELIKNMQLQIESLKSQLTQPTTIINQNNDNITRMVKVISMLDNSYTLSTLPNCQGTIVRFEKYGDIKNIRFADLQSMIQLFTKQFENGYVVFTSKKDYEDLGLGYVYDDIIEKEKMDEIISLSDTSDIDIILDMSESMQDNVLRIIANKYVKGYPYDMNIFKRLKYETNIDDYIEIYEEDVEDSEE